MTVRQTPWNDLRQLTRLLRHSWHRHRDHAAPLSDFTFTTAWRDGVGAQAPGPYMFSLTQFTPNHTADILPIWRAAKSLTGQLVRIEQAVGITTYLRPGRGAQVGSLSVWTDQRGLETFMSLPYHVEIMNRYRGRGLPVRSATWWSNHLDPDTAVLDGLRMLDSDDSQRVTLPQP